MPSAACRALVAAALLTAAAPAAELPSFRRSAWFDEWVREEWVGEGVRVRVEAPGDFDANCGYSDAEKHGDKLLAWLQGDASRRLVVIAYDDRNITLNGKLVVSADGGTFRATERMRSRFARDLELSESKAGDFTTRTAL